METLPVITKQQAVALYKGNMAALARALGIGRAAVCKWPDGPIADEYALKIRYILKPECFESACESDSACSLKAS